MKKLIIRIVILGIIGGGAWYGYSLFQQMPARQDLVATAKVRQGDVVVRSYARGELRAVRSATLTAPNLFGTVQVTQLAPIGSFAREKDLVVEFDDAEVRSRLEEKELEIEQLDEQYKKNEADLNIRANQDQVDLLSAQFAVKRAELEVKRNELLSEIDRKKNLLTLEETKRRLSQMQNDIKSRREQAKAQLDVLRERKQKSLLELEREKQRLNQVRLLAPMSGLVSVKQNTSNRFGFGFQVPDIREGDQVQPGMPVAEVLDLSELEVVARIGELDRANLNENQEVLIALDAVPDKMFKGAIKSMSSMASANINSSDPAKKFDVVFSINMKDLLTGLGASPAQVQKVLETAERNRKKPFSPSVLGGGLLSTLGGGGQQGGANMPGAGQGMQGPGGPPTLGFQPPGGGDSGGKRAGGKKSGSKGDTEASAGKKSGKKDAGAKGDGKKNGPSPVDMMRAMGTGTKFTEKEMADAKLPPPPEEDAGLDVLLRPGLLADVQIIVEKFPNAVHIPAQAVFDKEGKLIVYVKNGNKFEERQIKIAKRSESTLVIASGLKANEVIALTDPTARKGDKKGKDKSSGGSPMGAVSGSGGGK
jgi:HlyD family secretion protein